MIFWQQKRNVIEADLVYLSPGVPRADNSVASLFKLQKEKTGFYEIHMKLRRWKPLSMG